jgi:hypothetical protein
MSPALAQARAVERRVQGIDSALSDLVLRDGESLTVQIGKAINPTPTLSRTIQGSSTIKISLYDPELRFLRAPLLAEKWNAELDGLHWRYVGMSKSGLNINLALEDRNVARLREFRGPKKVAARRAQPDEVTRAEFVLSLVQEALPTIHHVIPELHVQQPIASTAQAEKANEDARDRREGGLGDVDDLTMDGASVDASQLELGETALRIANSYGAPFRVQVALMEALMAESALGEASPGNVLQALGPGGAPIGSAVEEIKGFLTNDPTWTGEGAIEYARKNPDAAPHEIAQATQASAFSDGSNYAKFADEAREWVEAFDGAGAGENTATERKPRKWEVGKDENYWEAIQRLAKEVNWRAFIVGNRFYYIDEYELARGMVRMAISADAEPGDKNYIAPANVNFDYNGNKSVTEVTIKCPVRQWKPPPGSVVTLAGFGPASIGFGDAALRKGQKIGLSGNRKAATGEGRARYIVASIEAPLTEDPSAREATIKLRKPTAPLPEPAAQTRRTQASPGSVSSGGGIGEMGVLEGTPEDIVNSVVDYAHTHGFPAVTRESVRAANAAHGPTVSGGRSDHQGPPDVAWAADISNGETTPEEDDLAQAISEAFDIPWNGSGLVTVTHGGYQLQLIYRTMEGGNHFTHVHFGCHVI